MQLLFMIFQNICLRHTQLFLKIDFVGVVSNASSFIKYYQM